MGAEKSRSQRCGIVLAGGDGRRLQPLIRRLWGMELPKQYVNFLGTGSMYERTIDRVERLIASECLFTVVARDHLKYEEVRCQLRKRPSHTVVIQPKNRETAPGLLLPLMHLFLYCPDSIVAVFPSDQFIAHEEIFADYVQRAFEMIELYSSRIIFLGVDPTEIEPGYGYILPDFQEPDSRSQMKRVKSFIDRPTHQIASQVTSLGALWNTMAMVFRPETIMDLIALSAPKLHHCFRKILKALQASRASSMVERIYRDMPSVDLFSELLEVIDIYARNQLYVLPMKGILWSDWDTEDRILESTKRLMSLDCLPRGLQLANIDAFMPAALRIA
jgi:mannose-1-phosphate guanylyltransferase